MKLVCYVPCSKDALLTEEKINNHIAHFELHGVCTWLTNLIKPVDSEKYMLVLEREDGAGTLSPAIGVRVIETSENTSKTEDMINDTFKEMELDEDKNFISIARLSEFIYIILYENKAGTFPRAKIFKNHVDPHAGSTDMSFTLQTLDDDDQWGLQPFDSFMIDKENMLMLFE
jgi:hypothetical protein